MIDIQDIAYISGFFDGEGCIHVGMTTGYRWNLVVSIVQKDRTTLDWILKLFPGGRVQKTRTCYQLSYCGARSKSILTAMYPYLQLKRERCLLALEMIDLTGHSLTEAMAYQRDMIGDRIKSINQGI